MSANRLKLNAEKTELVWAGTKHTVASLVYDQELTLTIGTDTAAVADAVRVLGVLFTPDLALEKHATSVTAPNASSNCVNCDVSDDFCTATVQLHYSSCVRHQSHRLRQLTVHSRAENLDRTAVGHGS